MIPAADQLVSSEDATLPQELAGSLVDLEILLEDVLEALRSHRPQHKGLVLDIDGHAYLVIRRPE